MDTVIARGLLENHLMSVPRLSKVDASNLSGQLLENCSLIHKKAGDNIVTAGIASGGFFLCLSGLLRNYYLIDDGKYFNKSFIVAPSAAGALAEYVDGTPGRFNVDCLEDSLLLKISFQWLRKNEQDEAVQRMYISLIEHLALVKERREESLLTEDAAHRYRFFRREYHTLEKRIPDYHIAAYLGITPVAFSRMKKNLNLG